jgi:hypothetical protein
LFQRLDELVPAGSAAASGLAPLQSSAKPVRYNDGIVTVTVSDLSSADLGLSWGQSRSLTMRKKATLFVAPVAHLSSGIVRAPWSQSGLTLYRERRRF